MKKFYIVAFMLIFGVFCVVAQDLIALHDGSVIEARVTEISPTEIRYRRFDHLEGPVIVLPAVQALSIRFENGMVQIINPMPPLVAAVAAAPAPARPPRAQRLPRLPPLQTPRLNTIGVSAVVRCGMVDGLFIPGGVVQGTFSPADNFFIEGGVEVNIYNSGFRHLEDRHGNSFWYDEWLSIHPYVNAGLFLPFENRGGWYAAAGLGLRFVRYWVGQSGHWGWGDERGNATLFVVNLTTGFNFWNWLDVSYTFRTNFRSVENRFTVGYVYRFMQR